MPTAAPTAPAPSSCPDSPAQQLAALLERAENGQPIKVDELSTLTRSPDRATRGPAKRLLAILSLQQAQHNAAQLLFEACEDLCYNQPAVFAEAVQHAHQLRRADLLFSLWAGAAEHAVQRQDPVTALVRAQNAAAVDFQFGNRHVANPDCLRRLVQTYGRVARACQQSAGVVPARRHHRRSPASGKLRLVHVVGQLVDGGHAPSRVTETLLKYADRERFDHHVAITEALVRHTGQSGQIITSLPSERRGPQLIRHFERDLGVPVLRPRSFDTFVTTAADLHQQFAEHQIDVAFFHGSIATPADWLLCAWQAAPWQLDRGFGTPLYCPQLDYQYFDSAETMEPLAFLCREHNIPYGLGPQGSVDLSGIDDAQPFAREELGIPADHVILGTVGNHLPERMSARFCKTVAGVLHKCPKTTYVIIGPGKFPAQRAAFGPALTNDREAGARVRFAGLTDKVDRWTLTFDVYLNEYPGGGGISVCEAMAGHKPVVCMKADDSSLSLAGALYVGEENLVQPPSDEAYAQRMGELIADAGARNAMGQALRTRYEEQFDARHFVSVLTERAWHIVHSTGQTD